MNDNKNLTVIDSWQVPTKEERETILNYDEEQDSWHIYTDVPKHARKYEKYLDENGPHRKGYSVNGGKLAMLDGYLISDAYITIRTKLKLNLTDEQRQQARERMKELHKKKRG